MRMPGVPDRIGPAAQRTGVLLRRGAGDIGDRDRSSFVWDGGLFDMARARQPALDALVHLLGAFVLDRDRETGEMRGERTAGQDVPVVLAGVAINGQTSHRCEARVLERAKTKILEELLACIAAAHRRAALGTGLEVGGRLAERVRQP